MDYASVPSNIQKAVMERWVKEYGTSILRMCYTYLRDASLAEDAAQDTFIKAYQNMDSLRATTESGEKAWLMRIAINTCKDYKRSAWLRYVDRRVTLEDIPPASYAVSPEDRSLMMEIMKLPAKYREVILLYYYQGLNLAQMGDILKLSESAVHKRIRKAQDKLRTTLEGWCING